MTKLSTPAGVGLSIANRRLTPAYMVPMIVGDGFVIASSLRARATATASATPHTKGPWTQIVAATTSPIQVIYLHLNAATNVAATDTSTLFDIGIGAAAAEDVIVPDIAMGYQTSDPNSTPGHVYTIPVNIPVGSRIAIRCQSAVVSKTVAVQMVFAQLPNGRSAPSKIVAMGGANMATTSYGVALPTTAANNTKTAWQEIIAATAEPFDALMVGVQGGGDTTQNNQAVVLDIGYGSSGNEVILGPDLPLDSNNAEYFHWQVVPLLPCRLPAGTRLAARWAGSSTSGSTLDVILYGVRS